MISRNKILLDRNYSICENNSNKEVIDLVSKFKTNLNEDSIYNAVGINNPFIEVNPIFIKKLKEILRKEQYDYLLNQEAVNSTWNKKHIHVKDQKLFFRNSKCNIFVTKPIYSKDKTLALVFIKVSNNSSIKLFERKATNWELLGSFSNYLY